MLLPTVFEANPPHTHSAMDYQLAELREGTHGPALASQGVCCSMECIILLHSCDFVQQNINTSHGISYKLCSIIADKTEFHFIRIHYTATNPSYSSHAYTH